MTYIRELNVHTTTDTNQLKTFLARFDLWLDDIDYGIVLEQENEIVGSCCKLKNIVKCFAIDPAFQGEGIANRLLSEVSYRMFEEGYLHSFVFTKPMNQSIFTSLGYETVEKTNHVVFLEKGPTSISSHIESIKQKYDISGSGNGAIVMNGNPFTLGHQYLIEYASSHCKQLMVFVVEEDASSFPFKDRFSLIQKGTSHLPNVIVIPSGQYIISQATFPNYFLRDKDNGFSEYSKLDVSIFGSWYCRQLEIAIRFVGEEPLDPMTKLYNETMHAILPPMGVQVDSIPRKQTNASDVISASKVRALIKEDKLEEVKQYVPSTTYEYLLGATDVREALKQHDRKH